MNIGRKFALDNAIQELRKALHLQMMLADQVAMELHYSTTIPASVNFEALDECNQLIARLTGEIQLLTMPEPVFGEFQRHYEREAAKAEALIRYYKLDTLPDVDLNALLGLSPLPFSD